MAELVSRSDQERGAKTTGYGCIIGMVSLGLKALEFAALGLGVSRVFTWKLLF